MKEVEPTFSRRRAVRRSCALPIELRQEGSVAQTLKCDTVDVSAYGCYINLLSTFPRGTTLEATLWLGETAIQMKVRVVATDPAVGNGIEFTALTEEQRTLIAAYLDQIKAPEAGSDLILH